MPMEPIVNRVAESEIEVYNLEELWDGREIVSFDLEPYLYKGLVLREAEFRDRLKGHDWEAYRNRHVAVGCSADAIVPTWAYMLVASRLHGIAASVAFGSREELIQAHFTRAMEHEDWERFRDRMVVIKGCGSALVPISAYLTATLKLQGVVRKLMFGEPCSAVPLWRRSASAQASAQRTSAVAARPVAPPTPPVSENADRSQ